MKGRSFKLSPSDFAFAWEDCKRCFWLKMVIGFKRPRSIMPKIFTNIDSAMKNHYMGKRTEDVAPELPPGVFAFGEKWVESNPIKLRGFKDTCFIKGKFDTVLRFDDGSYGVKETLEKRIKGEEKKGTQQVSHYRVKKKLGEGGMGAVYLAEDTRNGNKVALKILPRKHAADGEFMKRFKREAEAACKLDHPNIIRAFEAGEDAGYHFYVMEYSEGEPLDTALKRQTLLSWHKSFEIVREVSRGLAYAHGQGFIHRDIKPANIFITSGGIPKILDLGLTKKIDESQLSFQTLSGAVIGTPHYISPEQAKSDKSIDGRTDIYSLGAMLYHLLTGEPPFSGTTLYEILSKHVNAELPNPQDVAEDIPDGVVHVLRKMMAKNPNDRYEDCGKLLKDVELVLQGKTPESVALGAGASSVAVLRKRIQGARRKRAGTYRVPLATPRRKYNMAVVWGGAAAAGIVLIVLLLVLITRGSGGEDEAEARRAGDGAREGTKAPLSQEEKASQELDDILRFKGLAANDTQGQIRRLEALAREYQETFAAARARAKLHQLRKSLTSSARPADDAWIAGVQKLPPDQQVKRVENKLRDLNPEFQATLAPTIEGDQVTGISFSALGVTDITPLKAFADLRTLKAMGTYDPTGVQQSSSPLSDLRPLEGLPLNILVLNYTSVEDLRPLSKLPLVELHIATTPVSDLTPLRGLNLKLLRCNYTLVSDIEPLRGMPLEWLRLGGSKVADLAPLAGMRLGYLDIANTLVSDLSPLKGMRLGFLDCGETKISDLTPLKDVNLDYLSFHTTKVSDLSVLKGKRLTGINLRQTLVTDLSPLKDMPLTAITFNNTRVNDLSPLRGMPLRHILCDFDPARDTAILKSIPTLVKINELPVAEFWKKYDTVVKGLVGWWKLDDGKGGLAADVLHPGQDAILRGDPSWTKGKIGGALKFDGKDDYVEIPNRPDLENIQEGSYTIAAWFKPESTPRRKGDKNESGYGILIKAGYHIGLSYNGANGFMMDHWLKGGHPLAATWNDSYPPGIFYHVAGVVDRKVGAVRIYVDGSPIRSNPFDPADPAREYGQQPWRIGIGKPGGKDWAWPAKAIIDDVRLYNRALSEEEVKELSGTSLSQLEVGQKDKHGWVCLFNGRDLTGWDHAGGSPQVQAGSMLLQGGAGIIWHPTTTNYEFKGKIRLLSGSSQIAAVLIGQSRSAAVRPKFVFLVDGDVHLLLKGSTLKSGSRTVSIDRWHNFRLRVVKGSISLEIEGRSVLKTDGFSPERGLHLYTPGPESGAAFKDLWLRELLPDGTPLAQKPWRAIFDGRSSDCITSKGGWRVERGALTKIPGTNGAAQTIEEFQDGEIRVRFEVTGLTVLKLVARQGQGGGRGIMWELPALAQMEGRQNEIIFTCQGSEITATLNGKLVQLAGKVISKGRLQFNASGRSLRVLAIDYRELPNAAVSPWRPIFDRRTLDFIEVKAGWRVEDGVLTKVPGVRNAAQTVEKFRDGQIRIRFEVGQRYSVYFSVRGSVDGYVVGLNQAYPGTLEEKPHELIFTCQGEDVTATLDGKSVRIEKRGNSREGQLQFNCVEPNLRVLSIDFRELR